ncbi:hypothetical protein J2Z37_001241 [Ammoniphilus resinae]|uniref:Uncharacterized protein n=1 Tax=Ammoniphilus resinae TaxID=861532 RepID=A0ABS4GLW9_9BACL|nr:hypothetical protein [Ammoniphilus resinae]
MTGKNREGLNFIGWMNINQGQREGRIELQRRDEDQSQEKIGMKDLQVARCLLLGFTNK